jgi:hypothetical protein
MTRAGFPDHQVASKSTPKKAAQEKADAPKKAAQKKAAPKLLSGGNPQIAKGEGDAPVKAYIAAMPGWKRELGEAEESIESRERSAQFFICAC